MSCLLYGQAHIVDVFASGTTHIIRVVYVLYRIVVAIRYDSYE